MRLEKRNELLWLQDGWTEFSKHYSIKRGHLIVFRYEGNSKFNAVIFDDSTVEIDYPIIPIPFDESDSDEDHQGSKRKGTEESDSFEIFEEISFSPEEQSPPPSSWQHKRRKTSHTSNETKAETAMRNDCERKCETSKRNGKSNSSKPKRKGVKYIYFLLSFYFL